MLSAAGASVETSILRTLRLVLRGCMPRPPRLRDVAIELFEILQRRPPKFDLYFKYSSGEGRPMRQRYCLYYDWSRIWIHTGSGLPHLKCIRFKKKDKSIFFNSSVVRRDLYRR